MTENKYIGLAGLKHEGQPYTHDEDLVRDCPEVDLRADVKRLRELVKEAYIEGWNDYDTLGYALMEWETSEVCKRLMEGK